MRVSTKWVKGKATLKQAVRVDFGGYHSMSEVFELQKKCVKLNSPVKFHYNGRAAGQASFLHMFTHESYGFAGSTDKCGQYLSICFPCLWCSKQKQGPIRS